MIYTYEVDFNNLIFYFQGLPMFNLRHMPLTSEKFLEYLQKDNADYRDGFGHTTYNPNTPMEHRWDTNLRAPPPEVDQTSLDSYKKLQPQIVEKLVDVNRNATERLRSTFIELVLQYCMRSNHSVQSFLDAKTLGHNVPPTPTIQKFSFAFFRILLQPPIFIDNYYHDRPWAYKREWHITEPEWDRRWWWARGNVFVHFRPHLTDLRTFQAAISETVSIIDEEASSIDEYNKCVYAVINSISDCVIVKYDRTEGRVQHTSLMRLVPSFHQSMIRTEGIDALMDLCLHLDELCDGHPYIHPPPTKGSSPFPMELLWRIASFLEHPIYLFLFASASQTFKRAAKPLLMRPIVDELLLTSSSDRRGIRGLNSTVFNCAGRESGLLLHNMRQWKDTYNALSKPDRFVH